MPSEQSCITLHLYGDKFKLDNEVLFLDLIFILELWKALLVIYIVSHQSGSWHYHSR